MYISGGSSITVDVENLGKKLDDALGKVERTLSKAQKAAGLQIESTGRLVNSQGKLVEGLTLTQVKLGQYVDEQGKIHTANGEFVADLNKIEQQLGFYADSLGNVYNAQGDYIRQTNEAAKAAADAAKQQADAARDAVVVSQLTRKAFSDSFKGFAGAAQQASSFVGILEKSGIVAEGTAAKFQGIAQALSITAQTFQSITDVASGIGAAVKTSREFFGNLDKLAAASASSVGELSGTLGKLSPALAALGGPAGLAVGAVAAVGVGAAAVYAATRPSVQLSETFKEIEANAKKAGDSIQSMGDALRYGAFSIPLTEYESALKKTEETSKKVLDEWKRYQQDLKNSEELLRTGDMAAATAGASITGYENAKREQENAWADYSNVVAKMIEAAREEQKTELDKLEEQRRAFETIKAQQDADKKLAADAEARAIVAKKLATLDEQIAAAKNKEAEEAAKALSEAQANARRAAGIDRYLQEQEAAGLALTREAYEQAAKDWTANADALGLSQEAIAEALGRYKNAIDDATKKELAQALGVDFQTAPAKELDLDQKFERLARELDAATVTEQEYRNALAGLQDQRAKELAATVDGLRSAKDFDALEERRADALAEIAKRAEAQQLDDARRSELLAKIESDYADARAKLTDAARAQLEAMTGTKLASTAPLTSYEDKAAELTKAFDAGTITQKELDAALDQLKGQTLAALPYLSKLPGGVQLATDAQEIHAKTLAEIDDALRRQLIDEAKAGELRKRANDALEQSLAQQNANAKSALALDAFIQAGEAEKDARTALKEQFDKFKEAERKGVLSAEELSDARKSYAAQLDKLAKEEREAKAKEREQARADQRAALGIDSLLEELKTPLERYRETMDKAAAALKSGAISANEALALEGKATEDYWKALADNTKTAEAAAQKLTKFEASRSMSSGSEALYLAQVRNTTANYQATIQSTTAALLQNSNEANDVQRETNELLVEVVDALGGLQTFTG